MASSFSTHFQQISDFNKEELQGYTKNHFDTVGFCSSSLSRELTNRNLFSRLQNSLAAAINQEKLFPKAIILVLDGDFLKSANHYKPGLDKILGPWIKWITRKFHRTILSHKERLPTKSRRFKYPAVLWVPAMTHESLGTENHYRETYNNLLTQFLP